MMMSTFAAKYRNEKCFACERSVKRVVTCGEVLYRTVLYMPFFIFLNCILVFLADTKILCFEIILSNVI